MLKSRPIIYVTGKYRIRRETLRAGEEFLEKRRGKPERPSAGYANRIRRTSAAMAIAIPANS